MDVGNKSLAQLSEEAKEKKYVTLETGSKISGYTKDYLERLCRLNKVEYRMWNNGQFVIELESLLSETHTILLSYEDITFVDKAELTDPFPQIVGNVLSAVLRNASNPTPETGSRSDRLFSEKIAAGTAQDVPNFGNANRVQSRSQIPSAFSFVGRAVVSDPLHPEDTKEEEVHVPMSAPQETRVPQMNADPVSANATPASVAAAAAAAPAPEKKMSPVQPRGQIHLAIQADADDVHVEKKVSTPHAATHIAITADSPRSPKPVVIPPAAPSIAQEAELLRKVVHLNVSREKDTPDAISATTTSPEPDEWDKALLAPAAPPDVVAHKEASPSPYHPITTSVDASEHHDPAPLLPPLSKDPSAIASAPQPAAPVMMVNPVAVPTPVVAQDAPVLPVLSPVTEMEKPVNAVVPDGVAAAEFHPGIPDLGENKRVLVFTPEPNTDTIAAASKTVAPASGIASSPLDMPSSATPIAKPTAAAPSMPAQPVAPEMRPAMAPAMRPKADVKGPIASTLPMVREEHDLMVREDFPLVKNPVFNTVFALFLIAGFGLLVAGGFLPTTLNSTLYVAGVGAVDGSLEQNEEQKADAPMVNRDENGLVLPFSDEIATSTGSVPGSLIIRPVFKDGKGPAYEYTVDQTVGTEVTP